MSDQISGLPEADRVSCDRFSSILYMTFDHCLSEYDFGHKHYTSCSS